MIKFYFLFYLVVTGLLIMPGAAQACPTLKKADPRVGSILATPPTEIRLYFSGPVLEKASRLDVLDAHHQNVSEGTPFEGQNDSIIAVKLKSLPPGRYKVVWGIRCDCEGETQSIIPGSFSFTVANASIH